MIKPVYKQRKQR